MPNDLVPSAPVPNPKTGAPTGDDPYLPSSGNGGYTVTGYDLDLDYRAQTERLEGTAVITAVAVQKLSRFSLDLVGLVASKVSVNGTRVAKFSQADGSVSIRPATPLPAGQPFTVMLRYGGFPHATGFPETAALSPVSMPRRQTGWVTSVDAVHVVGQPNGAATWFPCNEQSSSKAPVRIRLTCDTRLGVVATGALLSRQLRGDRCVWLFATDEPVAPHQVGLSLGEFSAVHTAGFAQFYASAALVQEGFDSLEALPRMQAAFEDAFGPFPHPSYAVLVTTDELSDPVSAHGLSVFAASTLFPRHENPTGGQVDVDAAESLIAGTFARQWFGASVTARSWRDAWLHEGFALYASWIWAGAHDRARAAHARLAQLPQNFLVSDPGPARLFDETVATRGALALHALRLTLSDDGFFALLRGWCEAHRHGTATTEDFVGAAGAMSPELRTLLHDWLDREPLPPLPHRP
jgi:aminopeptidase N